MYFSQNITHYYEPIDRKKPHLGRHFVTIEQMRVIEESNKRKQDLQKTKQLQEKNKQIQDFLSENFTEEEIQFLIQNWSPPE